MEPEAAREVIKHVPSFVPIIIGAFGTITSVTGLVYAMIRNFRLDLDKKFDKMDKRMDSFDKRMDNFELKITSLEERMFWLATGKTLSQAILEEKEKKDLKNG
jgi:DNA replication initiation complex subunit (GINS family)